MAGWITTAVFGLIIAWMVFKILTWRRVYVVATSMKFPVFVSPIHITDIWWHMFYPVLVPILESLPSGWTDPWLPLAQVWSIWKAGHAPFERVGSDTVTIATPQGNVLWTCDTQICNQLLTRHQEAHIAIEMLKFFEVYGPTVGTSVGDEWRAHRRVINTGFTPSTNAAVWRQSTLEMDALISHWHRQGAIIPVMKHWTSRFALHIISAVMFGRNLTWGEHSKVQSDDVPAGFSMSFEQAIFNVLARIGTLYVTPKFLLRLSPTQRIREANVAFGDWTRYMRKLCEDALSRTGEMASKRNKSIIEAICSAIQIEPNQSTFETLQDNNVLGNVFFMILAGHETTGNTLAFTLDLLALYPEYQREIQRELDGLLKDRPWHQWTVDREYAALQKGWSGAVLKESLRLYCVVQFVVRKTVAPLEVVDSQGQTHAIPAGTLCALNFAAAFRDPKTWSKRDIPEAHRQELHNSPAIDFDPSRWLEGDERAAFVDSRSEDAPLLFPFGIGQRHCPGRMFAQIEMTAFVVTLLKDFSLEPVVSETTLQRCGRDESKAIEETRKHGFRTLIDDIDANITLQLTKELPLKIVRRTS